MDQKILRSKGIKVLVGTFFVISLSCAAWNEAFARSDDFKIPDAPDFPDAPSFPKMDNNMGGSSLDKSKEKIPIPSFDIPTSTMPQPGYIKYKKPDFPNINQELKANLPAKTFKYFNSGLHYEKVGRTQDAINSYKKFIELSPFENKPYMDFAKLKISELEKIKIDQGLGKRRWWEIFKPK